MYRETEASPFLTKHAERLVQIWLARADRTYPGFVWNVPDPLGPIRPIRYNGDYAEFEPMKYTQVSYHRRVGKHDVFLLVRDGERVYYCPQTGKFLENV